MDEKTFAELAARVSNKALAQTIRATADLLDNVGKKHKISHNFGPVVCNEAAHRLELGDALIMKQVEDLSRRIYAVITPENVALGAESLKHKIVEAIATN